MENFRLRASFFLILILTTMLFTLGCYVRTYTVLKERPDQEMTGNRGYLLGQPPAEEREITPRKTYVMEVEFGKSPNVEIEKTNVESPYLEPVKEKTKAEEPAVIEVLPNLK